MAALVDRYAGDLSVLHYNAAALHPHSLQAQSIDSIGEDLHVDVTSALIAARQAYAAMSPGRIGSILFTGGILAINPVAHALTLSVGKAALCRAGVVPPVLRRTASMLPC